MSEEKKKRNTKQNIKLLWRFLKGSKHLFALSIFSAMLSALADMVSPQIIRMAIDNALGGKEPKQPRFVLDFVESLGGFASRPWPSTALGFTTPKRRKHW